MIKAALSIGLCVSAALMGGCLTGETTGTNDGPFVAPEGAAPPRYERIAQAYNAVAARCQRLAVRDQHQGRAVLVPQTEQ